MKTSLLPMNVSLALSHFGRIVHLWCIAQRLVDSEASASRQSGLKQTEHTEVRIDTT